MSGAYTKPAVAPMSNFSTVWWNLRSGLLILSTFFPYFALPAGSNTNLPASSLLSLLVIHRALRIPGVLIAFILVGSGPTVLAALHSILGTPDVNYLSLIIWPAHVLPLFGFAGIAIANPRFPLGFLRTGIGVTVLYSAVQKIFLEMGIIPLIGYYNVPGYASVQAYAETITRYIRRPFAFFPEPSFMAGSLALSVVALIVLTHHLEQGPNIWDYLLSLGSVGAIYLSDSGSALVSIGLILFTLLWPRVQGAWKATLIVILIAVTVFLGSQVLNSRSSAQNYSWNDRSASIIGALRYFSSSSENLLLGAGKGIASSLFSQGLIPLDGLQYFSALPDVFSVIARLWLECGLIFGVTLTIGCLVVIFFPVRAIASSSVAVACSLLWVLVAGLTISYESAAWIWAFPGVFFGLWMKSASDDDIASSRIPV